MKKYTIGLDFGSLSCRGILVDTQDGSICAEAMFVYPHGVMTEKLPDGTSLEPDFALQHPRDFREALEAVVKELVNNCSSPENIVGIAEVEKNVARASLYIDSVRCGYILHVKVTGVSRGAEIGAACIGDFGVPCGNVEAEFLCTPHI